MKLLADRCNGCVSDGDVKLKCDAAKLSTQRSSSSQVPPLTDTTATVYSPTCSIICLLFLLQTLFLSNMSKFPIYTSVNSSEQHRFSLGDMLEDILDNDMVGMDDESTFKDLVNEVKENNAKLTSDGKKRKQAGNITDNQKKHRR